MTRVVNSTWLRLFAGMALLGTLLVAATIAASQANAALPGADSIILELEDGNNRFIYGESSQDIEIGSSSCSVTDASLNGPIMNVSATTYNKHGNPVDPAHVGLVEDGLGVNEKGNGNGQDCGRVDELGDGTSESLTLTLGDGVMGRLIESVDFDFEAKFNAQLRVDFLLDGATLFSEDYDLSEGSDDGPDSKYLDKYSISAPQDPANVGTLFDGVRLTMLAGAVALEGGDTWPDPEAHRTVFNLIEAFACGDAIENGGPDLADDPLAAFYVGPNTKDDECAVVVNIETTNTSDLPGGEQTVIVAPPLGYEGSWTGATGVVTIEWDIEVPDDDPIDRTYQRDQSGVDPDEIIPWCEDVVGIAMASGEWFYHLDPDTTYPTATAGGDVCLIEQTTETVLFDDGLGGGPMSYTQTTEVFYIWNDPMWVRK